MQTNQTNAGYIIRDEVWSEAMKEEFKPWLFGQSHVMWITDFPDGDTHTIPTMGRLPVRDYTEGDEITTEDATLGEIQITIDKYKQTGFVVSDKMKQDSYAIGSYIARAQVDAGVRLREQVESDVFNVIHTDNTNGHTEGDLNNIDSQPHRFVANATADTLDTPDIAKAKRVFDKANVPYPRYAFVDPVVAENMLNDTSFNGDVLAQDVYGANSFLEEGFSNNMIMGRFMGFIFMQTNLLPTTSSETIDGDSISDAVVNLFIGPEAIYGAMRQDISAVSFRDPKHLQDVYHATMRYGLRVYRPESIIAILAK